MSCLVSWRNKILWRPLVFLLKIISKIFLMKLNKEKIRKTLYYVWIISQLILFPLQYVSYYILFFPYILQHSHLIFHQLITFCSFFSRSVLIYFFLFSMLKCLLVNRLYLFMNVCLNIYFFMPMLKLLLYVIALHTRY